MFVGEGFEVDAAAGFVEAGGADDDELLAWGAVDFLGVNFFGVVEGRFCWRF